MGRPHGTLRRYKSCRCPECRAVNAAWHRHRTRQIAYGQWEPYEDAAGTQRRLAALMWNGWSMGQLGDRLGRTRNEIRRTLHVTPRVTPRTAAKVRALYGELWDVAPPEGAKFEKMAATKARKYAREHGFVSPWAWDDDPGPHCIDDPAAVPVRGWERRDERRGEQSPSGSLAVAAAIRRAREAAGMSQQCLAATVGVSRPALQLWEYGKRTPTAENWVQLELTLGPLGVVRDRRAGDGEEQQRGEAA